MRARCVKLFIVVTGGDDCKCVHLCLISQVLVSMFFSWISILIFPLLSPYCLMLFSRLRTKSSFIWISCSGFQLYIFNSSSTTCYQPPHPLGAINVPVRGWFWTESARPVKTSLHEHFIISKIYPILRFCWGDQEFIDLTCWWGQILLRIVRGVSLIKQYHRKTFFRTPLGNAMMQQLIMEKIHSNRCAMSTTNFPSITCETNNHLTADVRVLEFQDIKKMSHIDLPVAAPPSCLPALITVICRWRWMVHKIQLWYRIIGSLCL